MEDPQSDLQQDKLRRLRQQAQAALERGYPLQEHLPDRTDFEQLVEELRIYQVELEMQNDELVAAQQELEDSRQQYIDLYDFAPVGYLTLEEPGKIIMANLTVASLLGVPRSQLIGRLLSDFVAPEAQDVYFMQWRSLLEDTSTCNFELPMLRPDGSTFEVRFECSINEGESALRQARIAIMDISAQRQAQQERAAANEANRLKTLFLAMVIHELKAPLTPIIGYSSLLLSPDAVPSPEDQHTFNAVIFDESEKLLELVEQLLEFSRLQGKGLPLQILPQPIDAVYDAARLEIDSLATRHRIHVDFPDDMPAVMADQRRIAQVLVNLVSNAAKHSPANTPIAISAKQKDDFLEVSVSDRGSGIPLVERGKAFDAFQQGEDGLKQGGTGLGLAICKSIVEAHGGLIWIDEQVEVGTVIRFTLPIAG